MTTAEGRIVHATYAGRSYDIPEIWLMGFCTARGEDDSPRTMQDAIAWWAYQSELAERERDHPTERALRGETS